MALPKFGKKRVCQNCSVKFYDFNKKTSIKCPQCNEECNIDEIDNVLSINSMTQLRNKIPEKEKISNDLEKDNSFSAVDDINEDDDEEVISLDEVEEAETEN